MTALNPGESVHFVSQTDGPGATRLIHRHGTLVELRENNTALVQVDAEQLCEFPMGLSRDAGTWHPIGGYGCG